MARDRLTAGRDPCNSELRIPAWRLRWAQRLREQELVRAIEQLTDGVDRLLAELHRGAAA